jgi:DNA-binding CsgD family transcriptional regulator
MTNDDRRCLTRREIDVLVEIAMGYSAKEIAIRLSLAPRTVDKHVETMLLKLCARNRSHMVVMAIHDGIICLIGGPKARCGIVPCDDVYTRVNVHPAPLATGGIPVMA